MTSPLPPPSIASLHQSLIRYDNPVLISSTAAVQHLQQSNKAKKDSNSSSFNATSATSHKAQAGLSSATIDILHQLLPPITRRDPNGELWIQYVSSQPATQNDVTLLSRNLDLKLSAKGAKSDGLCEIRQQLYTQALDELIRHITLSCAERGILLWRIRSQLQSDLHHLMNLYESSIAHGMRKSLVGEVEQQKRSTEKQKLVQEIEQYEKDISECCSKRERLVQSGAEGRALAAERQQKEMEAMRRQVSKLKAELEGLLGLHKPLLTDATQPAPVAAQ